MVRQLGKGMGLLHGYSQLFHAFIRTSRYNGGDCGSQELGRF